MNRKLLTAIMTTIQILLLMLAGMPAAAADGGIVSGSVYYDSNGNSQPELGEANVPNATVYVELTGAETPFVVTTDAAGYFVLTGLPLGVYRLWAEDAKHNRSAVVELGEVTGASSVELPIVYDVPNEIEETSVANLYLPLVTAD